MVEAGECRSRGVMGNGLRRPSLQQSAGRNVFTLSQAGNMSFQREAGAAPLTHSSLLTLSNEDFYDWKVIVLKKKKDEEMGFSVYDARVHLPPPSRTR